MYKITGAVFYLYIFVELILMILIHNIAWMALLYSTVGFLIIMAFTFIVDTLIEGSSK